MKSMLWCGVRRSHISTIQHSERKGYNLDTCCKESGGMRISSKNPNDTETNKNKKQMGIWFCNDHIQQVNKET